MDVLSAAVPKVFRVGVERPLTIGESEPEPDISVVRGRPEDWLHAHPATAQLVIEISVSSEPMDREKAFVYAEAGIPEYWLALPESRSVLVYSDPSPDGYRRQEMVPPDRMLCCSAIPEVQFQVESVFPQA